MGKHVGKHVVKGAKHVKNSKFAKFVGKVTKRAAKHVANSKFGKAVGKIAKNKHVRKFAVAAYHIASVASK